MTSPEIYEIKQRTDFFRIQQVATMLGTLITNYSREHNSMLNLNQLNMVEEGETVVRVRVGDELA